MHGVVSLYKQFREQLACPPQAKKLARMQLLCRLEDYLTKEFAAFILEKSDGQILPILNTGKKDDQRRIDIAFAHGSLAKAVDRRSATDYKPSISTFVEVKYVGNRHRWGYNDAQDEIEPTFKSLQVQLGQMNNSTYAGYPVHLRGNKHDTYGLVFVSYTCRSHEETSEEKKSEFQARIKKAAKNHHFLTSNMKTPKLSKIYSDVQADLLGATYLNSLSAGLWRLDEAFAPQETTVRAAVAGSI